MFSIRMMGSCLKMGNSEYMLKLLNRCQTVELYASTACINMPCPPVPSLNLTQESKGGAPQVQPVRHLGSVGHTQARM